MRIRISAGQPQARWLYALLVTPLILTACGSGETASPTAASDSDAAGECSSLQGETIEFAVPYNPGGGYDLETRMMAPYLEEATGATVVVVNQPGAGGAVAGSSTFVAKKNANRIQYFDVVGTVASQLGEFEGINYDVSEFQWLASTVAAPRVLLTAPDTDITVESLYSGSSEPLNVALTGPGAENFITLRVLQYVYDLPAEGTSGFPGSGEMKQAVLRGDVDATIVTLYENVDEIEDGEFGGLLVIAAEPLESVPDVPALDSLPEPADDARKAVIEAHLKLYDLSRAIGASPNMPAEDVACLRSALAEVLSNEELLAEGEKLNIPFEFGSGEEMQEAMTSLVDAPPAEYVSLLKKAGP